jgi:hypothetical protein
MRAVDTIPDPVAAAAAAAERAEGGERRRGKREEFMKRLQDQMVD